MNLLLAVDAVAAASAADERWLIVGFVLLGLSIVLFAAELFLPSAGLLATCCGLSLVGSAIAFFVHDWRWGVVAVSLYAAGAPAAVVFGLKVWQSTPLARRMILDDQVDEEAGPRAAQAAERKAKLRALIGARGVAVTPLRPVGFVRIAGERVDALAETGLIDAGAAITVVDVTDEQLRVRAAE